MGGSIEHVLKHSAIWESIKESKMKLYYAITGSLLILSLVAFAQEPDREPDRELLYTTTIGEDAGRIILRGKMLDPPYEIYATRDTIKINDIIIQSRDPEPEPYTVDSNSSFEEKRYYKLFCAPFDSFAVWCEQVGSDSAMKLIEQLYKSFEEVDTVYGYIGWALFLKVKHRDFPEIVEFQPPLSEERKIEQKNYQDSILVNKAIRYERTLRNGNLIVLCSSVEINIKDALVQIDSIENVTNAHNLDYQMKIAEIRKIIKDSDCAKEILENWGN